MHGELGFQADLRNGFVKVTGSGLWTPEQTAQHFRNLEREVLKIRHEHGSVRVLVDLHRASVQVAATAEVMREWTSRIYKVADRVAVVCATMLLAMQVKRAANVDNLATFHDLAAAEAWIA